MPDQTSPPVTAPTPPTVESIQAAHRSVWRGVWISTGIAVLFWAWILLGNEITWR